MVTVLRLCGYDSINFRILNGPHSCGVLTITGIDSRPSDAIRDRRLDDADVYAHVSVEI